MKPRLYNSVFDADFEYDKHFVWKWILNDEIIDFFWVFNEFLCILHEIFYFVLKIATWCDIFSHLFYMSFLVWKTLYKMHCIRVSYSIARVSKSSLQWKRTLKKMWLFFRKLNFFSTKTRFFKRPVWDLFVQLHEPRGKKQILDPWILLDPFES
jgi:hypothetical protein